MEAIERQAKYDALSIDEKINLAKSRQGNSAKEIARLLKLKNA
jgi:DNA-binding CsgD family transcriptional regulator